MYHCSHIPLQYLHVLHVLGLFIGVCSLCFGDLVLGCSTLSIFIKILIDVSYVKLIHPLSYHQCLLEQEDPVVLIVVSALH